MSNHVTRSHDLNDGSIISQIRHAAINAIEDFWFRRSRSEFIIIVHIVGRIIAYHRTN